MGYAYADGEGGSRDDAVFDQRRRDRAERIPSDRRRSCYLAPYTQASKTIDGEVRKIRVLTADNAAEQARLTELQSLTASKLAELAETIALRRQNKEREALAIVLTDRGKNLMDEIRRVSGEMNDEETSLLTTRNERAKATAEFASHAMIFGGLAVIVLVSIVGLITQRSITGPLSMFVQFASRGWERET